MTMAAAQTIPTPKLQTAAPRTFTLSGKSLACYQAGRALGTAAAYQNTGENLRRLRDHQQAQLVELRRQLLEHPTFPIPDDHPLKPAIERLPSLADGLVQVAEQFESEGHKQQTEGSQIMGRVAIDDEVRELRWSPPLKAWAMLALVVVAATVVATLAASYASRAGW